MKQRNKLERRAPSWLDAEIGDHTPRRCSALRSRWLCFVTLLGSFAVHAALPVEWQQTQEFDVSAPGLVKISLPVETVDAARPALEDLRVCDDAGNELPFLITRPVPAS